jgi:hypothetical protein
VVEQNKIEISFGGRPACKLYLIYCTDMRYQIGTRNVRQGEGAVPKRTLAEAYA